MSPYRHRHRHHPHHHHHHHHHHHYHPHYHHHYPHHHTTDAIAQRLMTRSERKNVKTKGKKRNGRKDLQGREVEVDGKSSSNRCVVM